MHHLHQSVLCFVACQTGAVLHTSQDTSVLNAIHMRDLCLHSPQIAVP